LRLAWAADSGRLPSAPGEAALAAGFAVRRLRYSLRQRVQGNAAVVVSTILLLTVNLDGGSAWLAALAAVLLAVSLGNIAFEVWREPRLQRVRWGP
jgi:hypothetical protein